MNRIITLGREFGSGGRELGRRLSEKLGIAYYDQEIITEIAKRTALSVEYIHRIEDSVPVASFPIHIGRTFFSMPNPVFQQSINLFRKQHKLISELAEKSDCLIVGRCADYILRDSNPFRIFVYADAESKLKRCMDRKPADESLTEKEMKKKIAEIDRGRSQYYGFFSDRKWGARENYDLLINTSGADIKLLAEAAYDYVMGIWGEK